MKLSMWMIANRLSPLMDMRCNIRAEAKAVLNSARLAYATNCVHVYDAGDHVVYDGEGDTISIYGISVKEAFEIVQGVFDYFQDWEEEVRSALAQRDFQRVIDLSWVVFQNPMMLLDANNMLLGITRQVSPDDMDLEWQYLCKYGYSSLNSVRMMKYDYQEMDFGQSGGLTFSFRPNSMMHYGGVSYCMMFGETHCGRLTLLSKNRALNTGDSQLMQKLTQMIEPVLGASVSPHKSVTSVFYSLLFGQPYNEKELRLMLTYQQWLPEDTFQLALVQVEGGEESGFSLGLLANTITHRMSDCVVLRDKRGVLVLANWVIGEDAGTREFFDSLCVSNPLQVGFSLPLQGLEHAPSMLSQARAAIDSADQTERHIHFFQTCAPAYMLGSVSVQMQEDACHPVIVRLWQDRQEQKDDLFDTLKAFLDCERSLNRTAAVLFAHRNTVLYRIKKCESLLGEDLSDPAMRYYLRLSMYVLERKAKQ